MTNLHITFLGAKTPGNYYLVPQPGGGDTPIVIQAILEGSPQVNDEKAYRWHEEKIIESGHTRSRIFQTETVNNIDINRYLSCKKVYSHVDNSDVWVATLTDDISENTLFEIINLSNETQSDVVQIAFHDGNDMLLLNGQRSSFAYKIYRCLFTREDQITEAKQTKWHLQSV